MRTALLWLRILVVASWAADVAGIVLDNLLIDELPGPLRAHLAAHESLAGATLASILLLVSVALHVVGSAGILLAWPAARLLYTAGVLLAVPISAFLGHDVVHAHASALYAASSLATGGALALLWLSPAAQVFGSAAEAEAELRPNAPVGRAIRGGALLAVGALAGIGALVLAGAVAGFFVMVASQRAASEGEAVGRDAEDIACLAGALERARQGGGWNEETFLESCLDAATASATLCANIPELSTEANRSTARWTAERCGGEPDPAACETIYLTIQSRCTDGGRTSGTDPAS